MTGAGSRPMFRRPENIQSLTDMPTLLNMLQAHPGFANDTRREIASTLEALALCQQSCLLCADACLGENDPATLRTCIQRNFDCAAVCHATADVLLRRTRVLGGVVHAQLHACVVACQACADTCAEHARHHHHCTVCADVCAECQSACNELLATLAPVDSSAEV